MDTLVVMSLEERQELAQHEQIIERGLKTFVDVGNALLAIRERKLYRDDYKTFETYCQNRWGFTSERARLLMRSAEVMDNLSQTPTMVGVLPTSERQARPLIKLEPEQQREVWERAFETAPEGKITGAHVARVVSEIIEPESESFILGFPQRCPYTDEVWHNVWTSGECELCVHYRKRQPWGHGCQHPERDSEKASGDPDNEFETEAALIVDEDNEPEPEPIAPSTLSVHFSSETPEHYTPQVVIDATLACLGGIDIDPCSNSSEQPNVPASVHFTREDDGLLQAWNGRVYMNPPYGREIDQWVEKLCEEHRAGRTTEAIALVPSRTDTQWWQRLRDFPVCFVTGRLTFVGNDDPAPFPSAIFYLGENIGAFYRAFHELGDCWQRMMPGVSFGE